MSGQHDSQFDVDVAVNVHIAVNAPWTDSRSLQEVHLRAWKNCWYGCQLRPAHILHWNVWSTSVVQNGSDYLRHGLRVMSRPERFPDVPCGTWETKCEMSCFKTWKKKKKKNIKTSATATKNSSDKEPELVLFRFEHFGTSKEFKMSF